MANGGTKERRSEVRDPRSEVSKRIGESDRVILLFVWPAILAKGIVGWMKNGTEIGECAPACCAVAQAGLFALPGIFNRNVRKKAKTEMPSAIQKAGL